MKSLILFILSLGFLRAAAAPLALHPQNPHYFLFGGKPTVLITSGEHYGAMLNADFDYAKYLATLARDGLNGTRTFTGTYCEDPSAFGIISNTLAPHPGRFVCPWARSSEPGYANGGNKFDLNRWDDGYFKRLKDFMSQAQKRRIIVELNLFCPFYEDSQWRLSPMNTANNVNQVGAVARTNVYTLDRNGGLLAVQERMVRKLVTELNGFDNLYYEICNEPYCGGVTLDWQHYIADVIAQTEQDLGRRHLISQNIANGKARVEQPHPAVSILNFHYAAPPDTVGLNYDLKRVIGDNETGFQGTNDAPYRMEAWDFIVAGGGLFDHLDYSFITGQENGTFVSPTSQPGGGSPALRRQFSFLSQTMHGLDFVRMAPDSQVLKGSLPAGVAARALSIPGREYLIYLRTRLRKKGDRSPPPTRFTENEVWLELALPAGKYRVEWLDTKLCAASQRSRVSHSGGALRLPLPSFDTDIAIRIHRS